MRANRRSFIAAAGLAAAGNMLGLRPFAALNALAQDAAVYKALVCVYLYGGNDSNNTLIPNDAAGYGNYSSIRGALALAQNALLPLTLAPNFALNPNLPELRTLFNNSNLAFVANVGTLVQPLTQAQFRAGQGLPANLFSHADQQYEWQNASQSPATATGWGGRIADLFASGYNQGASIPMIASLGGDTLFCDGVSTGPVSIGPGNVFLPACSEGPECAAQQAVAQTLLTLDPGVSLVQADDAIAAKAYSYAQTLANAVQSLSPLKTVFPANNGLAAQLQQIAQLIQVRATLGFQRQIFFASLGNFDTHANQLSTQNSLLVQLSQALAAFYNATVELGLADSVTSFTMSDFSRAFQPNSAAGSDHGWGSHQMALGGAVNGGKIYGTFPTLALGGPDDCGSNGRWIPTASTSQFAATLAQWFGVPAANLSTVLPLIGNFSTPNLGFV
jgi:uncharacterized protein (DUF1501 family)